MSAPPLYKRPFDYIVSALRAVNADTDGGPSLQTCLEQLGQPLFGWPRPDGFPEKPQPWMGNLLGRWNVALQLTAGQINNTHVDLGSLVASAGSAGSNHSEVLSNVILGGDGTSASGTLSSADIFRPIAEQAALLLMSPSFQYR
jgi:uncharacterized protein (DUF1800 family)